MKYLIPLMDSSNILKQNQNNNNANNANLKFYLANKNNFQEDKKNKFGKMMPIKK